MFLVWIYDLKETVEFRVQKYKYYFEFIKATCSTKNLKVI